MSTVEQQTANQIANIEKSSGRAFAEWVALIHGSGLERHGQIVSMLKDEHGLSHGNANTLALKAREAAAGGPPSETDLVDSHYAGKNASLRPLYDAVLAKVQTFGSDIELAPKKTYVSLRRRKQFALVGPQAGQLEVCLVLPGAAPTERLKPTTGMGTHKVRISNQAGLDDELVAWLRAAYESA